jgi:hypothetical protein
VFCCTGNTQVAKVWDEVPVWAQNCKVTGFSLNRPSFPAPSDSQCSQRLHLWEASPVGLRLEHASETPGVLLKIRVVTNLVGLGEGDGNLHFSHVPRGYRCCWPGKPTLGSTGVAVDFTVASLTLY